LASQQPDHETSSRETHPHIEANIALSRSRDIYGAVEGAIMKLVLKVYGSVLAKQ
jgi:hypothetical protein